MDDPNQRRFGPSDVVALVLAGCLGVSLVALALGATLGTLDSPSERGIQIVNVLIGGILGILGAYMGKRHNGS